MRDRWTISGLLHVEPGDWGLFLHSAGYGKDRAVVVTRSMKNSFYFVSTQCENETYGNVGNNRVTVILSEVRYYRILRGFTILLFTRSSRISIGASSLVCLYPRCPRKPYECISSHTEVRSIGYVAYRVSCLWLTQMIGNISTAFTWFQKQAGQSFLIAMSGIFHYV
jgi:hypothetical protein